VGRIAVRPLDAVENFLKTMGFRNRGEKWRMGKNGGQKYKRPRFTMEEGEEEEESAGFTNYFVNCYL
jgi:hypothetical protein